MVNNISEAAELYKTGMSIIKVSEITGISSSTLQRKFKILGITRSNKENSRKYHVNHNFFNKIDNETKAYWLGMIYADGHISKSKSGQKVVSLCCKESDSQHLKKYKIAIEATYSIKHYTAIVFDNKEVHYARLCVTSDKLFDDLFLKGAIENKSLVLKFPFKKIIPKKLVHHFIRGYFDGDGSFSKSHDGYIIKILGTKEFLTELSNKIGFPNRKLSKRHKNKNNNWTLEIGGRKQVIKIGDFIYKNANVFLERKKSRYNHLVNKI